MSNNKQEQKQLLIDIMKLDEQSGLYWDEYGNPNPIINMSKIKQDKIPMTLTEDNVLKVAIEQGVIENEFNWKLVRERDGLTKQSKEIKWFEWNDEGRFKALHSKPGIGYSLIMSPFNQYFTWQTTSITEIVEEREDYIKFKTQNSNYELWKLKND